MRTWTRVYEQPLCAKNTEGGLYPVHPPKIQIAGTDISFTGNAGLCGIPGLPTCGPHLSTGSKIGIAFGVFVAFILLLVCSMCWWKRRQNILRAQRIAARDAPYAKARTQFVRDVQLTRHHELVRSVSENGPSLLS